MGTTIRNEAELRTAIQQLLVEHPVPTRTELAQLLDDTATPGLRRQAWALLTQVGSARVPTPAAPLGASRLAARAASLTEGEVLAVLRGLLSRSQPTDEQAERRRLEGQPVRQWPIEMVLAADLSFNGWLIPFGPDELQRVLSSTDPVLAYRSVLLAGVPAAARLQAGALLTRERSALELQGLACRVVEAELGVPLSSAVSVRLGPPAVELEGGLVASVNRAFLGVGPGSTLQQYFSALAAHPEPLLVQTSGLTQRPFTIAELNTFASAQTGEALVASMRRALQARIDIGRVSLDTAWAERALVALQRFLSQSGYRPLQGLSNRLTVHLATSSFGPDSVTTEMAPQ